jgi:hypothetical protein
MKIKNTKVYGLNESIVRSGYPMQVGEPDGLIKFAIADILEEDIDSSKDEKRAKKLSSAPIGSGHDNFLKGIVVQFDLQYPEYFSPQLQRYHWIDIISSQSKMHKIMSKHLTIHDFVLPISQLWIDHLNDYIDDNKFDALMNELPSGYLKWMGISTNYLQLKTIYNQRKNHKLEEWRKFCQWIETLPMGELITGEQK